MRVRGMSLLGRRRRRQKDLQKKQPQLTLQHTNLQRHSFGERDHKSRDLHSGVFNSTGARDGTCKERGGRQGEPAIREVVVAFFRSSSPATRQSLVVG